MDAPTDIPLKIQLGWRYHAPAAEEPARTPVSITALLQYTGKRWELITVLMANRSGPGCDESFYPKHTFVVDGFDIPAPLAGVPLFTFFSLFSLGL